MCEEKVEEMGFIQAIAGAVGGTLANQWLDYYGPKPGASATAAVFPGVPLGQNAGRGSNTKGNIGVITNGSKIVVPEGFAVVTMQDGAITGIIMDPGGYEYRSDDLNAQSIFAGDGVMGPLVKASFEKFKFGGIPGAQQYIFYVNLKEIPNNKFGTQSEIYWDDAFLGTQVGAILRGTYSLKIVDPILFLKGFVPMPYLVPNAPEFDLADMDNPACEQIFNEVVGSLSAAFSNYTNDPSRGNRMSKIQGDQIGFAQSLSQAVEENYQWRTSRGLEIVKTAIMAIEYDEDSKQVVADARRADALSGARGNSFMQQAAARGMQAAGENGGGQGMAFMGMGMGAAGSMMGGMQQPNTASTYNPGFAQPGMQAPQGQMYQQAAPGVPQTPPAAPAPAAPADPTEKLIQMKKLLDAGVLSQEEFDKAKRDLLGL